MKELERFYKYGTLDIDELISELKRDTEEAQNMMVNLMELNKTEVNQEVITFRTGLSECKYIDELKELLVNKRLTVLANEVCADYKECNLPKVVISVGPTGSPQYKGAATMWNLHKDSISTGIEVSVR